jgi:WD40 repeat protein
LLEIYDMQRPRSFRSWEVSGVPELSFSPDSRWLVSSVDFGTATISYYAIDPATGDASEFTIQQQDVWESTTFSADSQLLVAAAESGQIVFWTIPKGTLVRRWDIHPTCCVVSDLTFDPRGRYLAMSSPDGLELRRLADGTLAGYTRQEVFQINFVAKGTDLFLTGMYGDGAVMIWWIDK